MIQKLSGRGVLILAAVSLPVVLLVGIQIVAAANPGDVLITEVLYDCPVGCTEAGCEWVELYNATNDPITTTGWTVCDGNSCDAIPTFTIGPLQGLVVAGDATDFANCSGYSCDSGHIVYISDGAIGGGLDDTSEVLCILDDSSNIVDQMDWGGSPSIGGTSACTTTLLFASPLAGAGQGNSLQRDWISSTGVYTDTDTRDDFVVNSSPSPCRDPNRITIADFGAGDGFLSVAAVGLLLTALVGGGWALLRRRLVGE